MSSPEKLKRICLGLPRLEGRNEAEGLSVAWLAAQSHDALIHYSNGDPQMLPNAGPCRGQSSIVTGAGLELEGWMMRAGAWFQYVQNTVHCYGRKAI